jgi:hypothetical protein
MQLTGQQLNFLARLSKSPDGQALLQIFQARLAERDAALRRVIGEEVYRNQGRALELSEIIADITEADARLTRNVQSVSSRTQRAA